METQREIDYHMYLPAAAGQTKKVTKLSEITEYKDILSGNVARVQKNVAALCRVFPAKKKLLSDDPLSNARYQVIIATAVIVRICAESGMDYDEAYRLGERYIRRADLLTGIPALSDLLGEMQLDFAARMHALKRGAVVSIHVRKCIDYIYEHLPEKITISMLADHVKRHPSYLSKLFASEMGKPIHVFIQDARIETAQNMLSRSELPYVDIALTLGFSSQSAFINVFRKKTGLTPKQFRDQALQEEIR